MRSDALRFGCYPGLLCLVRAGSTVAGAMQTTHKIPGDGAVAFAAYLTSTPSRGDYYLGEDGEPERPEGRWHGSPSTLRMLGVDPQRSVGRGDLVSLMGGVAPRSGVAFRSVGGDGSRVAGIDVTFSAPKSVSALWAVSGAYRRAQILAAHRAAVASAVARIECDVPVVRRGHGGTVSECARGLVGAQFMHTASRLSRGQEAQGGVPDPQLHTHFLVLGAERGDGRLGRWIPGSCFAQPAVERAELNEQHWGTRLAATASGWTFRPGTPTGSWGTRLGNICRLPRKPNPHKVLVLQVILQSGRPDLNRRPPAPKAGALPGCATPRGGEYRSHSGSQRTLASRPQRHRTP